MPTGVQKLYRVAFDVEARTVTAVLDFLATIKSYEVEWSEARAGLHHVEFMFVAGSIASVLSFMYDTKIANPQWPHPAQEVSEVPITEIVDLRGKKTITTADLREALVAAGRSPASTSYLASALRAAGKIAYDGGSTTGRYRVLGAKLKKKKPAKKKPAKKQPTNATSKGVKSNGEV